MEAVTHMQPRTAPSTGLVASCPVLPQADMQLKKNFFLKRMPFGTTAFRVNISEANSDYILKLWTLLLHLVVVVVVVVVGW